jgi:hypothetical protein
MPKIKPYIDTKLPGDKAEDNKYFKERNLP